ncbi:MAG: hypothetical protein NAOJABEB_01765 [Steroidobacteraceae bacterium]|nr:hypothetical protein [Steroidobacteraceae bacterium]
MAGSIGPLVAADEFFNHQIVETHASVLHSDHSWTEKVCGMACARDGSLSVNFGFGKYVNRNVVDGYGGASRGVEQWTVRASRALDAQPDSIDVGPLRYEVVEPLRTVRVVLERNDVQPLAYDLLLEGSVPCVVEEREDRRTLTGYRRSADQIRYHQTGVVKSGWIELEGQRFDVAPGEWIMTRDHSWGLRPSVGVPPTDLQPDPMDASPPRVLAVWNPLLFTRPDGSHYAFHQYYLLYAGVGWRHEHVQGGFEFADGRREPVRTIEPRLRFDPRNKRLLGGEFALVMGDGRSRVLRARALGGTGFHLGAGLYHGYDGKYHGQWRGPLHVEGEHFADCSTPEAAARLNQFRDCLIAVDDDETGAAGIGNCQTWAQGRWPDLGLPDG